MGGEGTTGPTGHLWAAQRCDFAGAVRAAPAGGQMGQTHGVAAASRPAQRLPATLGLEKEGLSLNLGLWRRVRRQQPRHSWRRNPQQNGVQGGVPGSHTGGGAGVTSRDVGLCIRLCLLPVPSQGAPRVPGSPSDASTGRGEGDVQDRRGRWRTRASPLRPDPGGPRTGTAVSPLGLASLWPPHLSPVTVPTGLQSAETGSPS